jgi:HTH-type transcriptional regulator / antitoxin HigA
MQNIRALKTEADYDWALAEVEAYFDNLPEPGSEAADRFDVLTDLLSAYESRNWPIDDIDPVDFLDGYMQNHGYGRTDLANVLGSVSRASEIMLRRRPLTLVMIQRLVETWGVPSDVLVKPYITHKPAAE